MLNEFPVLTPAQVAKLLGVSPITVRSWVVKGWLEANVTPGGHRRFYLSDVQKLLQEHGNVIVQAKEHIRVLVVDDDKQFRSLITEMLSDYAPKVEVAEAVDGFEAGIRIAEFKPDVILLDYSMPGLSGVSVCRQIKSNPQLSNIRIISVTGHASSKVVSEMLQAGAEAVLYKPVKTQQIIKMIGLELLQNAET